jgi:hypothetical protein
MSDFIVRVARSPDSISGSDNAVSSFTTTSYTSGSYPNCQKLQPSVKCDCREPSLGVLDDIQVGGVRNCETMSL